MFLTNYTFLEKKKKKYCGNWTLLLLSLMLRCNTNLRQYIIFELIGTTCCTVAEYKKSIWLVKSMHNCYIFLVPNMSFLR